MAIILANVPVRWALNDGEAALAPVAQVPLLRLPEERIEMPPALNDFTFLVAFNWQREMFLLLRVNTAFHHSQQSRRVIQATIALL